jgi:catechol 2,3-dioxygenase-like lactoylglutathione lyase family enzyme
MNARTRIVVAATAGCLVGSVVTSQLVQGQAKAAGPLDGTLSHISFAVTDVEKTAQAFGSVFGVPVPKPQVFRDIPWGPKFPGKVMHGKLISLGINGVSFEFLEPLDGESPWKDHITESGDGVHHIGFAVKDVAAAREALEAKGGTQTQGFAEWASYVDMHGAGLPITFEVTSTPPQPPAAK